MAGSRRGGYGGQVSRGNGHGRDSVASSSLAKQLQSATEAPHVSGALMKRPVTQAPQATGAQTERPATEAPQATGAPTKRPTSGASQAAGALRKRPGNHQASSGNNETISQGSNVRGKTCSQGARKAMKSAKTRLTVEFDFDLQKAICANAEAFNNEIGYIVRTQCDLKFKEWRFVTEAVRAPLRYKLLTLFDVDLENENVRKCIDNQMHTAWHGYRHTLRLYFKEVGGASDLATAKSKPPEDINSLDWDYLCDLWSDPAYLERALRNAESRKKRKYNSRNGSKSTARHHVSRGVDLDAPVGHIETWRLRHWHPERGWISPEAESKYEEMMQLRRDNPPEKLTDKQILENVLGRQSVRLFGWGRSPSGSKRSKNDSNLPTYSELVGTVEMMRKLLIEKNIIPPMPQIASDHCSGAHNRDSSSVGRDQPIDGYVDSTSEFDDPE